jgi:hypothetical protein
MIGKLNILNIISFIMAWEQTVPLVLAEEET